MNLKGFSIILPTINAASNFHKHSTFLHVFISHLNFHLGLIFFLNS